MNYDCDLLSLETTADGTTWTDIKGDFTSVRLSRSVSVDGGVLFRPESASLSLTTRDIDYGEGVYNQPLRLVYDGNIMFTGTIREVAIEATPGDPHEPVEYRLSITAADATDELNKSVIVNYSADEQTGDARAAAVWPASVRTGLDRTMAVRTVDSPTVLSVLQEVADANLARFYVNIHNEVVLDASEVGTSVMRFSDNHNDPDHYCYKDLRLEERLENSVTTVVVNAKTDGDTYGSRTLTDAIVKNEQRYTVDVPASSGSLNAWCASFPLKGFTVVAPTSMRADFSSDLIALDLLSPITVSLQGHEYEAGIQSIEFDIVPDNWNVSYSLIPGHVLRHDNVVAPSAPRNLRINSSSSVFDTSKFIELSWSAPASFEGVTGYEVRYAVGTVPPASRTDGTLLATQTGTTFMHNVTVDTEYAYSVWATTADAGIYSDKATLTAYSNIIAPSAPTSASAYHPDGNTINLSWSAPANSTYLNEYYLTLSGPGYSYSDYPSSDTNAVVLDMPNSVRNQYVSYWIYARSVENKYGATYTSSTAKTGYLLMSEQLPPAIASITPTKLSSSSIKVTWTDPSGGYGVDFEGFHLVFKKGTSAAADPYDGTWTRHLATTHSATRTGLSSGEWHMTVWTITTGGLFGDRRSTSITI